MKTRTVEISRSTMESVLEVLRETEKKHPGRQTKAVMSYADDGQDRLTGGFGFEIELVPVERED